ncbi:MAG: hypothetical protein LUQ69_09725 [Methanoregulaceae archaeon]|nr:hypothetical protein [Methanoregulaceae archaeon]
MGILGDVFGGLGSGIGGLIGLAGQGGGAENAYNRAAELFLKLQEPDFDTSKLSAEDLQIVGEYLPEVYDFVAPKDPQTIAESAEGRAGQVEALNYFENLRDQGMPELMRLDAEEAQNRMAQASRSNRLASMEALRRRGMGMGGDAIAANEMAGQTAADLARSQGNDIAKQAIQARIQAASQAGGLSGTLRSQDLARNEANANIWNNFQRFLSEGQTQAARDAAAARQEAQWANTQNRQRVSEANAANRQALAQRNQEYANTMKQEAYQNALSKAAGAAGQLGNVGAYRERQNAADVANYAGLGGMFGGALGSAGDLAAGTTTKKRKMWYEG